MFVVGDREVLDIAVGDLEDVEVDGNGPPPPPPPPPAAISPNSISNQRFSIDDMIEQLQHAQDVRLGRTHSHRGDQDSDSDSDDEDNRPLLSPSRDRDGPLSPSHVRGPRRSGEVEGVRQASGHVPVSQRATARDLAACRRRIVVHGMPKPLLRSVTIK